MMRGLLAKELREHRVLLLFLFLFLGGGLTVISGNSLIREATGSGFASVRFSLVTLFPLACLILNHALIASEFRHKTQLFLEGLPLPRWRMLLVKYLLGLCLIFASVIAVLFLAWWPSRGTEAMTPQFATLLLLKSAGWTWFLYSLFFSHAFLGRYRIGFAILVLLAFVGLEHLGVETEKFGPFQLVDDRFAFERHDFPAKALWATFGVAGFLVILGFCLGLFRDATVASLLAEKMSSREKVFITFLGITGLMLVTYLSEHFKRSTPVKLPGASEGLEGVAQVYATAAVDVPTEWETAVLTQTAERVAKDIADLASYLRCNSMPPVFIVHRRDLGPNDFQDGGLKSNQGLMVRANLLAKDYKPDRLLAWIERQILVVRTHGLADRERNAWVIDGFLLWRSAREGTPDHAKYWPIVQAGAGQAMPHNFNREHLDRWLSIRKDAGEMNARALAAVGLDTLARKHGDEACRQFLSDFFSRDYPKDVRGWFRDVTNPVERRLRRAANISADVFVEEWRAAVPKKSPSP